MVGKSNKFDFTNRSNSGIKLARVIGEAFTKELEKAKKDATRQANKLCKQSNDSAIALEAGRDIGLHLIDLKVPNKDLGDDGIREMSSGTTRALTQSTKTARLSLQHVNLRGNGITIDGLYALVWILFGARKDLKTLDLSYNHIRVETENGAERWEMFITMLITFDFRCKVDLSGNQELGWRAWEVTARVLEQKGLLHRPSANFSLYHDQFHRFLYEDKKDFTKLKSEQEFMMVLDRSASTTVPVFNITKTGLDDAGALWLSYIIPADALICTSDTLSSSSTQGFELDDTTTTIDWQSMGDALGKDGLQLLRWVQDLDVKDADTEQPSRDAAVRDMPRRTSGRHSVSNDADASGIASLRHKIQRHIIQQLGVHEVQLWKAALSCVHVSRCLLVLRSKPGPGLNQTYSKTLQFGHSQTPPHSIDATQSRRPSPRIIKITSTAQDGQLDITTMRRTSLSDVSNLPPANRLRFNKPYKNEPDGPIMTSLARRANGIAIKPSSADAFRRWQEEKYAGQLHAYDTKTCPLPLPAFVKIVDYLKGNAIPDRLSDAQLKATYEWGQDRTTLLLERDWVKLTESAQILTLLDHVKCLAYGE